MAGLVVNYALQGVSLMDDPDVVTELIQIIARDMLVVAIFTLFFQCGVTYVLLGLGVLMNFAEVLDSPTVAFIALITNYFESLVVDAMCEDPSNLAWMQDMLALLKKESADGFVKKLKA